MDIRFHILVQYIILDAAVAIVATVAAKSTSLYQIRKYYCLAPPRRTALHCHNLHAAADTGYNEEEDEAAAAVVLLYKHLEYNLQTPWQFTSLVSQGGYLWP